MTAPVGVAEPSSGPSERVRLREEARAQLGVRGDQETEAFRTVVRRHGLGYYPLVALGILYIADNFQVYAFTVLTPEISRSLGISIGAIAAARALQMLAISFSPLPVAALTQGRARRATLCIVTGLAWSVTSIFTGFVESLVGLVVMLCINGLSTGSVIALHPPLIVDSYHPEGRVRALSIYSAFGSLGMVIAPALVGVLAGVAELTWRGVFVSLGLTSILMTLAAIGLRDPGYGKWDTEVVRSSVRTDEHDQQPAETDLDREEVRLGFWEVCHRLLLIQTLRRVFTGFAVFGILIVPLGTFVSFFLDERWNMGAGQRGLFFAFTGGCGFAALMIYGNRGEKLFRKSPANVIVAASYLLGGGVVLMAVGGLMPVLGLTVIMFGAAHACFALLLPLLSVCLLSIVPGEMRPHAQALVGISQAIGGLVGVLLLTGIQDEYGVVGTMISVSIPGVIGACIIASARSLIATDLDRMIDDVIAEEEVREQRARGVRMPLLTARGIDFSYGPMQVLFDVDFTVDDGEMVALLGVNGAGKSTLLKVISGIGLPSTGSVHYRGQDVTYLDAERRLRLGIAQVPGGRAVFGPLTVADNLRAFGYSLAGDKQRFERAIEESYEAFPRLYERRNSPAGTLSGGEQQMLALSKALMLRPRLLVIDELSLGLAPIVVGELLDMVRRINAEGTAVVLVEQSVNIALNLVEHAYFMEKGEIRFDGRSEDLLHRDDMLRAVFLAGTAAHGGAN